MALPLRFPRGRARTQKGVALTRATGVVRSVFLCVSAVVALRGAVLLHHLVAFFVAVKVQSRGGCGVSRDCALRECREIECGRLYGAAASGERRVRVRVQRPGARKGG